MNVIPMLKVDAAKRLVFARIDETPDNAGDVFDYDSSKPFYQGWSDDMTKASDGKSLGNVRAMHGLKAAGRVISMDFDDAAKAIDFAIEVVDDDEWTKVEKGVYTGVSPGGRFAKRWRDGRLTRYTGAPREISLVDTPCIPSAGFTMIKLDGGEELVPFAEPSLAAQAEVLTARLANAGDPAEYGALLAGQPEPMLKLLFPDGVPPEFQAQPEPAPAEAGDMIKGLCEVAQLAGVIEQLTWLAQNVNWEAEIEGDGSKLPGQLATWIKTGAGILTAMAAEESGEAVIALATAVAALPAPVEVAADMADMTKMELADWLKAGARNSASDQQVIQTIHDHAGALGAVCPPGEGDMAKIGYLPALARNAGDTAVLRGEMKKVVADRDMLKLRVTELERQPAPGGPRLRVVDRADDHGGAGGERSKLRDQRRAAIDVMPPGKARAIAETKFAMEFPG